MTLIFEMQESHSKSIAGTLLGSAFLLIGTAVAPTAWGVRLAGICASSASWSLLGSLVRVFDAGGPKHVLVAWQFHSTCKNISNKQER